MCSLVRKQYPKRQRNGLCESNGIKVSTELLRIEIKDRNVTCKGAERELNVKGYACDHCGKSFQRCGDYQRHLLIHSNEERPFKCSHCPFTAWRNHTLVTHLKIHSKELNYSCDLCGKRFVRKWAVKQHKMYHIPESERPFKCQVCEKGFARNFDLRTHISAAHPDPSATYQCKACHKDFSSFGGRDSHDCSGKAFKCNVCGKSFGRASSLKEHLFRHKPEKPYKCSVCPKSFNRYQQLGEHLLAHSGEKPFACDFCHKAYSTKSSLSSHIRQVHGKRPYKCDLCGVHFVSGYALKQHRQLHPVCVSASELSSASGCIYRCQECMKEFSRNENLDRHVQQVHGVRKYCCSICGKSLSSKRCLHNHKHVHTGELPHRCKVCGRRFGEISELEAHLKGHVIARFYVCGICKRSFQNSSSLKKHERIHSGEKPYSCELCGKAFTQNANLSIHRRIHTGRKEFKCEQCGKDFVQRANLRVHMMIHNGERPFKCDLCGKQFPLKSRLDSHVRVHFGSKAVDDVQSLELSGKNFVLSNFTLSRFPDASDLSMQISAALRSGNMVYFSSGDNMPTGLVRENGAEKVFIAAHQSKGVVSSDNKATLTANNGEQPLLISTDDSQSNITSVSQNQPVIVSADVDGSLLLSAEDEQSLLISMDQGNSLVIYDKADGLSNLHESLAQARQSSDYDYCQGLVNHVSLSSKGVKKSKTMSQDMQGALDVFGVAKDQIHRHQTDDQSSTLSGASHSSSTALFHVLNCSEISSGSFTLVTGHKASGVYYSDVVLDNGSIGLFEGPGDSIDEKGELAAVKKVCLPGNIDGCE